MEQTKEKVIEECEQEYEELFSSQKEVEDRIILIKQLIDKKIIYRQGDKFVFDFESIGQEEPELLEAFLSKPRLVISELKKELKERYDKTFTLKYKNLNEQENISDIRIEHIGKIMKITGLLSNATGVLALVKSTIYNCPQCGTSIRVQGSRIPKRCACGNRRQFNVMETEYQNLQEIVLEENQDEIGDRSPRKTRIRLIDELCDKDMNGIIKDGNKIECIGIVEEVPLKKDVKTNDDIYNFRLFGLQIRSLENDFDGTITEEDIEEMEQISLNNPLEKLSNSLSPSIIGHNKIKKALVLSMVSGVPRVTEAGKRDKHNIHILLVGDAGTSKSSMLQDAVRRHYRSKYVSGERLSEAGLLLSVEKDELLGVWSLKAGYLPKCNNGFAVIDELDKAEKGVQRALHTPMESGIVTIAKASINATLKADVTLVIAANPKGSRFNPTKPLVEQIDMDSTLLSRFDLIFPMRDKINKETDKMIAESIWENLDDKEDLISVELFKKYIKYCQKFKPKPTKEAIDSINQFYLDVREKSRTGDGVEGMPVIPRHLKGLRRLAEASAKIRLSNQLTEEDTKIAIELFKESLFQLGMDNNGVIDMARIGPGTQLSTKRGCEVVLNLLKKASQNGSISQIEALQLCKENGIDGFKASEYLGLLNKEGIILKVDNQWKI